MRSDIDTDVFLSKVFQPDELNDLGEVVSNERMATIILDALPEERHSTIKVQSVRDSDLGLEEIISIMKTIFINHSKRPLVTRKDQESYCKNRDDSNRKPAMNGRDSAMSKTTA